MAVRDLIVIGASAGGLEPLRLLVRELRPGLGAAVVLVMHLAPARRSTLSDFLARESELRVVSAREGQPLAVDVIHVAPPSLHVSIDGDRIHLDSGPHENGFRPAIDKLFRSAALHRGARAIGVILSGMRDDGTEGLSLIKRAGGATVVQDPSEALYRSMPESAVHAGVADYVVPIVEMPRLLARLVADGPHEVATARGERAAEPDEDQVYNCPECGGVAREVHEAGIVRYRCRVGHVYNARSFLEDHTRGVEDALWHAVNALSERKSLTLRMARRAREAGRLRLAERYEQLSREAEQRAEAIRGLLVPDLAGMPEEDSRE